MNDTIWKKLVRKVAEKIATQDEYSIAKNYLWDMKNYSRLATTTHGRFLREMDSCCPDLNLKKLYREDILKEII